jgi:hypothetical protein
VQTLLLIALLAAAPEAAETDADFAEDFALGTPGLALGPLPSNQFVASFDVGWLRSALRGQVGLGHDVDFVFWGDAFLLEDLFGQQNGLHTGIRYTPLKEGPFRLSLEGTIGAIFIAGRVSTSNVFALRGEVTAGATRAELGTVYTRLQIRGLTDAAAGDAHWGRDAEIGVGVERNFARFTFGAEGSLWTRPDLDGIRQWRLRVGYRL